MTKKNSGRGRPPPPAAPEPQSKAPAGDAKAKAAPRKLSAKAVKKTDKRGTPKGKGTVKGLHGGKIGNPPFEATAEQRIQVEAYVAAGAQQWLIAEYIGVSEATLQRHFRVELDHGLDRINANFGGSIVQKALAGDPDLMKFYAARRAGWKTTTAVEASGPGGGPIEYRDLSDEELDARIAKLTGNAVAAAKD